MTFNVSLTPKQLTEFRQKANLLIPEAKVTYEVGKLSIVADNADTLNTAEREAMSVITERQAEDILFDILPPTKELVYERPKTHKPLPQRIVRGAVRVERRVGGR